jgi:quercetin dioxygenase-like cupin family protein
MHEHPGSIVVWLTDGHGIITSADGEVQELDAKAGDAAWMAPAIHQGKNTSDQPFEVIQIEIKDSNAPAGTCNDDWLR